LRGDEPTVNLCLPLETAEALHTALEGLLEGNREEATLEKVYRILTWRILAVKGGTGLTGWMAESVEEYEAARDRALGPILDGLENAENRDP
jgi:hypothetical protein